MMYSRHEKRHGAGRAHTVSGQKMRGGRLAAMVLSTVLLLALTIGGTIAWLTAKAGPVKNTFTPSEVSCEVEEDFEGRTKSNVTATNTSNIEAYLRIRLVAYRTSMGGSQIGGSAEVPTFTPGEGWVKSGDYYYYTKPVAAGESPENPLIGEEGIELKAYDDVDGGNLAIDVIAEAIQSVPEDAVEEAWKVTVSADGTLTVQ